MEGILGITKPQCHDSREREKTERSAFTTDSMYYPRIHAHAAYPTRTTPTCSTLKLELPQMHWFQCQKSVREGTYKCKMLLCASFIFPLAFFGELFNIP